MKIKREEENSEVIQVTLQGNYIREYIELMNMAFKLSPREIEALANAIILNPERPFTTEDRVKISQIMGFNSRLVLNNLIKSIKNKKAILYDENAKQYRYHDIFKDIRFEGVIRFKLERR